MRSSIEDSSSDFSTLAVPTSTGWPSSCRSAMSSTTAANLAVLGLVDDVGLVGADHRPVGRDRHHAELVDLVQLGRLGLGRTGHAGELVVEAEVVLQRDGGERLVLVLDRHPLLGLDGLVHALVVAAAVQHAAGELVDDQHLAVGDDVVPVALVELLGLERVVQVADQRRVDGLVEVLDAELVLDLLDAGLGDRDRALALLDLVVDVLLQPRREPGELLVPPGALLGRAADDQRRPGLVDEDGVDLVDDGVVVPALDQIVAAPRHVVAQVVEAELVVGPVRDVRGVRPAAVVRAHLGEDHVDLETEEAVHPAHPLGVAAGQVVVRGDHVDALARQRVQVGRERADQRLALTGLHLGDVAHVQRGAAHQLDVEVPLAEGPLGRLPDDRERLRQEVVEGLAVLEPLSEDIGLGAQLRVRHVDVVGLERVDVLGDRLEPADDLAFPGAQDPVQYHGATSAPSKRLVTIVGGSDTHDPGSRTHGATRPCPRAGDRPRVR